MKTSSHHYFVQIRALLIALNLAFALAPSRVSGGARDLGFPGETLLPLRTGTASPFSYGLYNLKSHAAPNAPAGNNLVLVLRNVGAKWVNFPEIAAEDFALKDSHGKALKLELRTRPEPMAFGDATIFQIFVPNTPGDSRPWTLRFKSNLNAKVPFDISISGIKP
jgi:hypothetical protein